MAVAIISFIVTVNKIVSRHDSSTEFRMMDGHYDDPNFSTALLRKDLRLFLEEATAAGLQVSGLQGLDALLEQSSGSQLDDLDYCALHELTQESF